MGRPILLTLLARRGRGKTTLLLSLARALEARGVFVSPLLPDIGERLPTLRYLAVPLGEEGAAYAAHEFLSTAPGEWFIVDEIDSMTGANTSTTNPLLRVLSFARNLEINVALAAKTPAAIPRWATANSDVVIYQPWREPRYLAWLEGYGLPTDEPDGEYGFWATDFHGEPFKISSRLVGPLVSKIS